MRKEPSSGHLLPATGEGKDDVSKTEMWSLIVADDFDGIQQGCSLCASKFNCQGIRDSDIVHFMNNHLAGLVRLTECQLFTRLLPVERHRKC